MSSLPLLIEESDWQAIVAGVTQRASLMEAVLADVYGPSKLADRRRAAGGGRRRAARISCGRWSA